MFKRECGPVVEMDGSKISLRSLTMDHLTGVINLYPWLSAARKELCAGWPRWAEASGERLSTRTQRCMTCRTFISDIVRSATRWRTIPTRMWRGYIKEYINPAVSSQPAQDPDVSKFRAIVRGRRVCRVCGGGAGNVHCSPATSRP